MSDLNIKVQLVLDSVSNAGRKVLGLVLRLMRTPRTELLPVTQMTCIMGQELSNP